MRESNIIVDEEFKRKKSNVLKLNNAFSAENIKDISDKIYHYGKYLTVIMNLMNQFITNQVMV